MSGDQLFKEPLGHVAVFRWGLAGGVAQEVLRWRGLERRDRLPRFITRWTYWALTFAFALVGGVIAILTGEHSMLGAFTVGASSPALISRGAVAAAGKPTAVLGSPDRLVDWLRG